MTSVLPASLQGLQSMEQAQGDGDKDVPACSLASPLVSPEASSEKPQSPGALSEDGCCRAYDPGWEYGQCRPSRADCI